MPVTKGLSGMEMFGGGAAAGARKVLEKQGVWWAAVMTWRNFRLTVASYTKALGVYLPIYSERWPIVNNDI
ncbi:hypothetical protein SAMN05444359_101267 [Neolewinella agarilytica]|uniref:Uncharacterized protein n=1 Tax=Neolewinella agarilytica TaxID=478744 RepID=A0A1H8ZCB3_9BACT|nr:hypothetical protein SAMN05444359_101267 [Neolewinella agarilytica]